MQVGDIFFMLAPSELLAFPQPDDQILELITDVGNVRLTQGLAGRWSDRRGNSRVNGPSGIESLLRACL